jgi:hypothetical protein
MRRKTLKVILKPSIRRKVPFLSELVKGVESHRDKVASFYKEVLSPQDNETHHYAKRRDRLRSFFREEPEYERQLAAWIKKMEGQYRVW